MERGAPVVIRSRSNPKVKELRRLAARKWREREGTFFVGGPRLVEEAIATRAELTALVLAPDLLTGTSGKTADTAGARLKGAPLLVSPEVFDTICPRGDHHGIGAAVRQRWEELGEVAVSDASLWVALSRIEHPGSLGTIIRTCDAVGAEGVMLIGNSADPYDPTAVRASLGAVFTQRLVRTDLGELAGWRERANPTVVGTSPAAEADYQSVSYDGPLVLLMGSERAGLSPEEQACCDVTVSIPMVGRCESHHVAVAAAVVLYEAFHQRRRAGRRG